MRPLSTKNCGAARGQRPDSPECAHASSSTHAWETFISATLRENREEDLFIWVVGEGGEGVRGYGFVPGKRLTMGFVRGQRQLLGVKGKLFRGSVRQFLSSN